MNARIKGWFVLALLLGTMVYAIAEELTLTTYYPSPRGVYNELRTRGDVAIGKLDTPSARLEIVGGGATSATSALRIKNVDGTSLLEVQNGGNVGIGTASPAQKLHVVGNARIEGMVSAATFSSLSPLIFMTNGTERMRIDDTTGNVGIGTTNPGAKLEVAGQVKITGGAPGTGKVLTSDASGFASWKTAGGGLPTGVQVFTAPGTFTVPADVTRLFVEVYGGGGGGGGPGGNSPGGGGAGGVAMGFVNTSPGTTYSISVGSGGARGCPGSSGGTSSFGNLLSATGGSGGGCSGSYSGQGGAGGIGTGGQINQQGGAGSPGGYAGGVGGSGGSNTRGGGSNARYTSPRPNGGVCGGGGGGAYYDDSGGNGGPGCAIVWW